MRRLAALALVAGLLTGCGSDPDQPAADKPTASASPTGSASVEPTGEPWTQTAVPERPADVNTLEGAQAFGLFAVQTVFYVIGTGDPKPFEAIADLDRCSMCRDWVESRESGDMPVLKVLDETPLLVHQETADSRSGKGLVESLFVSDVPSGRYVNFHHPELTKPFGPTDDVQFYVQMVWRGDRWVLTGARSL